MAYVPQARPSGPGSGAPPPNVSAVLASPDGRSIDQRRGPIAPPDTLADASISMPTPHRNWGGIIALLIVDLALATAGGVLLARGLDDSTETAPLPSVTPLPPKPAVEPLPPPLPTTTKTAAADPPTAATTPEPVAKAVESVAKAPEAAAKAPEPAVKAPTPPGEAKQSAVAPATTAARAAPKQSAEPVDPYAADAGLAADVDRQAARSKTAFARCHHNAGVVDGTVRIAFSIKPDGTVARATAAENTTGSSELAACLANEVGGWVFSPHSGAAVDFVRAFTYR